MKKLLLTAIISLSTIVFAQKVDLDRFNFQTKYRDLPHNPLDSTFSTYNVRVEAPYSITRAIDDESIKSRVILQGFKKEQYLNGDLGIVLMFDDLIIKSTNIKESVSTKKNKDGTETKTYSYMVEIDYVVSGRSYVNTKMGSPLIKSFTLLNSSTQSYSSTSFSKRSDASRFLENNKTSVLNNLVRDHVTAAINEANRKINYEYGYPERVENSILWLSDHRKHPETVIVEALWSKLKPVLSNLSPNNLSDDEKSEIMAAISYFDEVKIKYPEDDKREAKLRYGSFYNNARLYLILDMPEKAIEEANGLIANDYDTKDGEKLKEEAQELIDLFNKNNSHSRHFILSN